ncbi:MAG: hypothetical protein WA461_08620 [Nitrososphaeraceae archaeon]
MSLLQKINVPMEFSPLIDAARGYPVNGDALKEAVMRAMEIMNRRLEDEHNGQSKIDLQKALRSLKSEFIIF